MLIATFGHVLRGRKVLLNVALPLHLWVVQTAQQHTSGVAQQANLLGGLSMAMSIFMQKVVDEPLGSIPLVPSANGFHAPQYVYTPCSSFTVLWHAS